MNISIILHFYKIDDLVWRRFMGQGMVRNNCYLYEN